MITKRYKYINVQYYFFININSLNIQFYNKKARIHLLVRDLKPPFLDGNIIYTKQLEAVQPIKDPSSDMAVVARKGSRLVREKRERQERINVRLFL